MATTVHTYTDPNGVDHTRTSKTKVYHYAIVCVIFVHHDGTIVGRVARPEGSTSWSAVFYYPEGPSGVPDLPGVSPVVEGFRSRTTAAVWVAGRFTEELGRTEVSA